MPGMTGIVAEGMKMYNNHNESLNTPEAQWEKYNNSFRSTMKDVKKTMKFDDDYKRPWVPGATLETFLEDVVLAAAGNTPGVAVILGPRGCGKSTRVKVIAERFVEKKILRGATYCSMVETSGDMILPHFVRSLGLPCPEDMSMSKLIPPYAENEEYGTAKVLLVLDQVEQLKNHANFDGFFTGLATKSHNNTPDASFVVIALCSETDVAERLLLLNGNSKFYAPISGSSMLDSKNLFPKDIRLSHAQCNLLLNERFRLEAEQMGLDKPLLHIALGSLNFIRVSNLMALAGTIGFCRDCAKSIVECFKNEADIESLLSELEHRAQFIYESWDWFKGFSKRATIERRKRNRTMLENNTN